jgi:tetratricopeptide (TPR) repeat protein
MHPDRIAIIFEIYIDHMIFNEENPFALIKGNNTINDEICFSIGTVFRVESIEQIIDNSLIIWVIKLKLVQDDNPQLVNLLTTFRTIDIHENPLGCLGKLLMDMGEYRRAEQFFLEMLNDTAVQNQPNRLVRVQIGLGANYIHKGDYAVALEYYEKSLELSLTYLPPDHPDLTFIYKSIGDCYLNQNNYMLALQNYERAIHIMENNTQLPISQNIDELRNLIKKTEQLI